MTFYVRNNDPSWDDLQLFLAVAERGSANAAAAHLGLDQSTVSRRLKAFQGRLNAPLIKRSTTQSELTSEGRMVIEGAKSIAGIVSDMMNMLAARETGLAGEVRVNITEGLGAHWLIPGLFPFQQMHPELQLNWRTTCGERLMPGRDVDLAVWWQRPIEPNLVTRKLGEIGFGLFAMPAYVDEHGLPETVDDLASHVILHFNTYDADPAFDPWRAVIQRFAPAMRIDSTSAGEEAIRVGRFIGLMPDFSPRVMPGLVRAAVDLDIRAGIWSCYHESQRGLARIKAVSEEILKFVQASKGIWVT